VGVGGTDVAVAVAGMGVGVGVEGTDVGVAVAGMGVGVEVGVAIPAPAVTSQMMVLIGNKPLYKLVTYRLSGKAPPPASDTSTDSVPDSV